MPEIGWDEGKRLVLLVHASRLVQFEAIHARWKRKGVERLEIHILKNDRQGFSSSDEVRDAVI